MHTTPTGFLASGHSFRRSRPLVHVGLYQINSKPLDIESLLRQVTAGYPNHVWGVDITYVRLQASWMYLVAILDWYSRYVVAWELDQTLELPFVLRATQRALAQAKPVIWNSDQGSHFTSPQYLNLLQEAQVQISMDGTGRALDNVFTERLWRTVKYEEVSLHSYDSPREARRSLTRYSAEGDSMIRLASHGLTRPPRARRRITRPFHNHHQEASVPNTHKPGAVGSATIPQSWKVS